jgi:two-component system, OmpR family, phosphate regulon response regulator PhoB
MQKPHILIVEDEAAIAQLLEVNLRHAGMTCDTAINSQAAQAMVFERMPDLVLLDWMLPGMSGFALAKQWRSQAETKRMPIIMLTAKAAEVDKVASLEAGADDYITKPFSTKELLARVRAVLRRHAPQTSATDDILRVGVIELDLAAHRALADGLEVKLAPTEFKLLTALMQQAGKAMDRNILQTMVWGRHSEIDTRTVDVHIKRLREALSSVSESAAAQVQTIRSAGYRLSSQVAVPA